MMIFPSYVCLAEGKYPCSLAMTGLPTAAAASFQHSALAAQQDLAMAGPGAKPATRQPGGAGFKTTFHPVLCFNFL